MMDERFVLGGQFPADKQRFSGMVRVERDDSQAVPSGYLAVDGPVRWHAAGVAPKQATLDRMQRQ